MEKHKIKCWTEIHRRQKWRMARRIITLPAKRWNRRVFNWHPGLDTSIRAKRQVGGRHSPSAALLPLPGLSHMTGLMRRPGSGIADKLFFMFKTPSAPGTTVAFRVRPPLMHASGRAPRCPDVVLQSCSPTLKPAKAATLLSRASKCTKLSPGGNIITVSAKRFRCQGVSVQTSLIDKDASEIHDTSRQSTRKREVDSPDVHHPVGTKKFRCQDVMISPITWAMKPAKSATLLSRTETSSLPAPNGSEISCNPTGLIACTMKRFLLSCGNFQVSS